MRKKKLKKQKRLLIIGTFTLLIFLSVGYAAFSTTISLNAKGNIKEYNAAWQLKNNIVTEGDGLYLDSLEPNRYIYKGQNPDNYITFNDELWRIISIENDDTLKIILDSDRLGGMQWDTATNRNNDNNTYCNREIDFYGTIQYWGCSVWNARSGIYDDGKYSGTVTQDATIKTYLNNDFYNSINEDQNYIISHDFNIGRVQSYAKTEEIYQGEKEESWTGLVGLVNVSDFLKASTNKDCIGADESREESAPCSFENGNWLDELKSETWTINAYESSLVNYSVAAVKTVSAHFIYEGTDQIEGGISGNHVLSYYLVRPVVYLKNAIKLEGKGTKEEPFTINDI